MTAGNKRKLAAIVFADVVSYSRMMGRDETGTLQRLNIHRKELIEPLVEQHDGRIVKTMGDGFLLEFPSVVEAVECALAIQKGVKDRNAAVPGNDDILFRVGVHLGDVIVEQDDIFGDGVNVAVRVEGVAPPGGVAVSGSAHDHVAGKIDARFEDLGEHDLKNIDRPIRIYRVAEERGSQASRRDQIRPPSSDSTSIAVLPFANMSSDPEQVYLADGIAEDILTGLARVRWLVVTSRNSSFAYRGGSMDLRKVARELGVRYILEGSVRRLGERVRITAQLIDAVVDRHIWAERFDLKLEDIFDLQDEITSKILGAIEPELGLAEQERARRKPPENLDAWDLYLRGQWHLFRFTAEDNAKAKSLFRQAISNDPEFAASHTGLAYTCHIAAIQNFTDDHAASIAEGIKAARRAVTLDDKDAMAYSVLARILALDGEYDAATMAGMTAVGLNPNSAQVRFGYALALILAGRAENALAELDAATVLSPHDPNVWSFMTVRGWALALLGRYEAAAECAYRAAAQPNSAPLWPQLLLATTLGHMGRHEEGRTALQRLSTLYPGQDPVSLWAILPFRNAADAQRMTDGIRAITDYA